MAYTKVKPLMVASFPSSRLTGAFGAISGANLTGLGDGIDTKDASSDPAINTNPSGGVGHSWLNKSSGEIFICIVATTDNNVWVNVGGGVLDVYTNAGTVLGYITRDRWIETVSLVSDTGGSTVAGLVWTKGVKAGGSAGCQSSTHFYSAGGANAGASYETNIEKIQFATSTASSAAGSLSVGCFACSGHMSTTHGYAVGGTDAYNAAPAPGNLARNIKIIQKFPFASSVTSVSIGNLDNTVRSHVGWSTRTYGYTSGGDESIPASNLTQKDNKVEKFSFSSDGDAIMTPSTITVGRSNISTSSSETTAYGLGGHGPSYSNVMDKFSYASEGTGTDIGDLNQAAYTGSGLSSTTDGYCCGGTTPTATTRIHKFSFASEGNADNVGDLTNAGGHGPTQGSQY